MIPFEWLAQTEARLAAHIRRTPLTFDAERQLYLKWENLQVTGSFKARGALNKVLALEPWERARGLVTASAGNHGQGLALAANLTGTPALVFASDHAVPAKLEAMRALGARVELVPGGYELAEATAIRHAREHGQTFVSAYNDGMVIAGQGTLALEVLAELPVPPARWYVPVGGGGLIAGIGAALRSLHLRPRLVGVQAEASAFMHALYYRGDQKDVLDLPTLADGLTGAVEDGSVTIPLVRELVDEIVLVTEEEIARAIAFAWSAYAQRIEGSAAVGLAAALAARTSSPGLVVVTGGNIQPQVHEQILRRFGGVA